MIVLVILGVAWFAFNLGYRSGLKDGLMVARFWESTARDYRMLWEMDRAKTPAEVQAAYERRELERMFDGI